MPTADRVAKLLPLRKQNRRLAGWENSKIANHFYFWTFDITANHFPSSFAIPIGKTTWFFVKQNHSICWISQIISVFHNKTGIESAMIPMVRSEKTLRSITIVAVKECEIWLPEILLTRKDRDCCSGKYNLFQQLIFSMTGKNHIVGESNREYYPI